MDVGIELLFDGSPGNSITDAGGFAKALEDMGFASLWLPDHVVVFEEYAPNYSYSPDGLPPYGPRQGWFDPLYGLAAMAATTEPDPAGHQRPDPSRSATRCSWPRRSWPSTTSPADASTSASGSAGRRRSSPPWASPSSAAAPAATTTSGP